MLPAAVFLLSVGNEASGSKIARCDSPVIPGPCIARCLHSLVFIHIACSVCENMYKLMCTRLDNTKAVISALHTYTHGYFWCGNRIFMIHVCSCFFLRLLLCHSLHACRWKLNSLTWDIQVRAERPSFCPLAKSIHTESPRVTRQESRC